MICYLAIIKKFADKGEKTGWRYIDVPASIAEQLKPATKVSFLVKGTLDAVAIKGVSLLPMGGGNFILPLKNDLRKKLRKKEMALVQVQLEADEEDYKIDADFIVCLADNPAADAYFSQIPGSHRKYFSKWIESARTDATKAKRIAQAVDALQHHLSFAEMMRMNKEKKL